GLPTTATPLLHSDRPAFPTRRSSDLEKQLSNIFAWLLAADGTHGLGDRFQQAFVRKVNERVQNNGQLPPAGYRVVQEVDTRTGRSEEHTSELQSRFDLVCRLLLEKKN